MYVFIYTCIPLHCFMHHTLKPHEAIYTLAHLKNKVIYLIPSFDLILLTHGQDLRLRVASSSYNNFLIVNTRNRMGSTALV